jgi:hypothetical protein
MSVETAALSLAPVAVSQSPQAEVVRGRGTPFSTVIRHLVFGSFSCWILYQGAWGLKADFAAGDASEYVLMTDALAHHRTPDLRPGDTWNVEAEERLKSPPEGQRDFLLGFIGAPNGRWYCWHFFFYPMLNLPMRAVASAVGLPLVQAFTLTNALFMICVVYQMLYFTRYPLSLQLVGATLFVCSSSAWYFAWPHPEVMTCAFVFMSLISWFHDRRYQAILLSSLAAMQNPPLFLLSLFYLLPTLFRRVPNIPLNVLLCGVTSFWVIVPPLFYRYHFGVGSLIVDSGMLNLHLITFNRFWGFFFDLDQGMIISLPTALPLFAILSFEALVGSTRRPYTFLLVPVLLAMTFFIMPMDNWNHGQAVINRYATWCSMIPLAFLIDLLNQGWNRNRLIATVLLVVTPQAYVVHHYGWPVVPDKAFLAHKEPALFMLEHFPRLYNPDPEIFVARTTQHARFTKHQALLHQAPVVPDPDVAVVEGQDGRIRKLMFRRGNEQKLLDYGWTEEDLPRIAAGARFINEWAYLHPGDFQQQKR